MTDRAFVWTREPNPAWVEALSHIAPRNPTIPWLHLFWEPGELYAPVQRWEIRELDPALQYYDAEVLAAYEGPHPRPLGHWEGEGDTKRWKGECLVSLRQWELYQQFTCPSRRTWVIQGPNGGHPFELSQGERAFKRALGREDGDTPAPGSLPYADPDTRTWRRLAEYDRLRKWGRHLTEWSEQRETKTAAGLYVRRNIQEEYSKFGQAMLDFFSEGIKEAIDGVPKGTLGELYDNSPKSDGPPDDLEQIEQRFIEAAPVLLNVE